MTGRLVTGLWLLFVWVALTGAPTVISVSIGVVLAVILLAYYRLTQEVIDRGTFRPWRTVQLIWYFGAKFLRANIEVALAVIRPERIRHRRGIVSVPIAASSEITTTLLANAVSLTPGTFILEIRRDPPAVMYVHVLELESVRALRLAILEMEHRIVRALGPKGSVERVEALMTSVTTDPDEHLRFD